MSESSLRKLAEQIGRLQKQRDDEARAVEAAIAGMPPQEQLVARARARFEAESIEREKATLEAIYAIRSVAEESAAAEAERAAESARREQHMADATEKLLTLTRWLLAAAFLTLLAAIATLIHAA